MRLEGFSGVPTSPSGGLKIRLSEIRSTAKDRVRIFPGKASVGLKKIHSAIFCYFFLKKVEGEKEKCASSFCGRLPFRAGLQEACFRTSDSDLSKFPNSLTHQLFLSCYWDYPLHLLFKSAFPLLFLLNPDIHRQACPDIHRQGSLPKKRSKSRCTPCSIGTAHKRVEIKAINLFPYA